MIEDLLEKILAELRKLNGKKEKPGKAEPAITDVVSAAPSQVVVSPVGQNIPSPQTEQPKQLTDAELESAIGNAITALSQTNLTVVPGTNPAQTLGFVAAASVIQKFKDKDGKPAMKARDIPRGQYPALLTALLAAMPKG